MRIISTAVVRLSALFVFGGCSTAEPPNSTTLAPQTNVRSLSIAAEGGASVGPAIAAAYRFPLAGPVTITDLGDGTKYSGQHEYMVMYFNTGGISAISEADSPQRLQGPPASTDVHDAAALSYLLAAGIPSAELGPKHSTTSYISGGPVADPSQVQTSLHGYKTVYERVVQGFAVPESHAAVELNSAGVPITVDIAWPMVPDAVIAQAKALGQVLSKGWSLASTGGSGPPAPNTHVIIKHSPSGRATLAWRAAIRTDGLSGTRHTTMDTDEFGARVADFDLQVAPANVK